MGAWGTNLYDNDSASDIRDDYVDKLRRGKTNEEVTEELIEDNRCIFGDGEEEPLFWFALADTQWNYGRLLPEVKEKALYFLSQDTELERWKESGEKKLKAWMETLDKLREKLNSEPPPPKKVSKYRLYNCKWNLGDVFAYKFQSDYSKQKGFYGKYVVLRKVSEASLWPGHIIPVIKVYKCMFEEIPSIDKIKDYDILEQWFLRSAFEDNPDLKQIYTLELCFCSDKSIPKNNLTLIGNLPGDDMVPYKGNDMYTRSITVGWEGSKYNRTIEKHIIDMYLEWKE